MAAFQGSQLVNILAAPTKAEPTSQDPFPPIGQISAQSPFPVISPSPQYLLTTNNVQGAWLPSAAQTAAYPTAGAVVSVRYDKGNRWDSGYIITTQSPTTIQAAF